jgi:hypothetical protein
MTTLGKKLGESLEECANNRVFASRTLESQTVVLADLPKTPRERLAEFLNWLGKTRFLPTVPVYHLC